MSDDRPWGMEEKTFLLLMHLAQFTGLLLPIIMWATNREKNQQVDEHGKEILNWIISLFIYCVAGGILSIIGVGFLILIAAGILAFVFPIIGAVKASNGEFWKYPLTLRLVK